MAKVTLEMTGDERRVLASITKLEAKVKSLEGGVSSAAGKMKSKFDATGNSVDRVGKKAGDAGKKLKDAFDPKKSITSFIAKFAGPAGVAAAVAFATKAINAQRDALATLGKEATKAGDEILAFAALQAVGTRAREVQSAARLAQRFGITDRGAAFETIQALESIRGKEEGRKTAEIVFAASLAGIPIDLGKELEVLGASQGAAPGAFVRKAFVAGELSGRDPKTLARAAPALKQFKDKDLGFAIAALISESVPKEQVATFTRQAGFALQQTGALQSFFEARGKGDAGKLERLRILRDAGITSNEQLVELGVTEQRQREALLGLIPNVERLPGISQEIIRKAKPGLFLAKRGDIEHELPGFRFQRQNRQLQAMLNDEAAFGPGGVEGQRAERSERVTALAFRRRGNETFLGAQTLTEEGRLTFMGRVERGLRWLPTGGLTEGEKEVLMKLHRMDPMFGKLENAAEHLDRAAERLENTGGGPTLIPPQAEAPPATTRLQD